MFRSIVPLAAILVAGSCLGTGGEEDEVPDPPGEEGGGADGGEGGDGGGTSPRCEAYPDALAVARLNEALGPAPATQLALELRDGVLERLDLLDCRQVAGEGSPADRVGWMSCLEAYACGGCEVWLGWYEGDGADYPESWYLVSGETNPASCDKYDGFYNVGDGSQATSESPTPDPGGGASGDACSDCLSACSGLPGCCTGSGCMCQGSCQPAGCGSGFGYCCGSYGDCICMQNCPY